MFDDNMELLDGSVDLNPTNDTAATSTTRDATTGAAVIDLGAGGTPASGLSAVLILPAADADADILTAVLEASDNADFSAAINEVGKFTLAAATAHTLIGSETPCVVILRFSTSKRYVRLNATVTASDDFNRAKCFLTPYDFHVL